MTIELEKTKEHAIEQAAHDISKAKAFSKLAQEVMVAGVGSIKISCNSNYSGEYLCGIENLSDDVIREDLAAFLDRMAERYRKSAAEWLEYGLSGQVP